MTIYGLALLVLNCVAKWKLFEKAGEEGWKAIIPFYSTYIYCRLANCVSLFVADLVLSSLTYLVGIGAYIAYMVLMFRGVAGMENYITAEFPAEELLGLFGASTGIILVVSLLSLAVLVAITVIRIFMNLKFVACYSSDVVFKVLAGIGSITGLNVLLVVARCILAFDEKYLYRNPLCRESC